MANELNLSMSLSFSKGGAKVDRSEGVQVDVTGDAYTSNVQEVGTSEEVILEGTDLGTPGYVFIKNLDDANYVEVGLTASYPVKLKAEEVALFRANGAIYAKANTAACNVETVIIED